MVNVRDILKNYITKEELVDLVDDVVNNGDLYVINYDHYVDTPFQERFYEKKEDLPAEDKYHLVNISDNFENIKKRKHAKTTLAEHSAEVLAKTKEIVEAIPNLYESLNVLDFNNMFAKENAERAFKQACYAGAYMHDIGKALIGVDEPKIDDHSYIGGNYIFNFRRQASEVYGGEWFARNVYTKIDNIIRWHMGYVLDKKSKDFIAERKPDAPKQIETYIVSLADWYVNTQEGTAQRKVIDKEIADFIDIMNNHKYNVGGESREVVIHCDNNKAFVIV